MEQKTDTTILEALAHDSRASLDTVLALFERERDALARGATITNYITLLAVRRVRRQLQQPATAIHH
jgi:hypothetical protein